LRPNARGFVLTENEWWTLSISAKFLLKTKRCFQFFSLITVSSETDVTGQQPITIEEGTRSRAACGAAIRIVLAVFVVRAGFRYRLGRRAGHWALETIGFTSFPSNASQSAGHFQTRWENYAYKF
jgi:hypothetical protein